MPDASAVIAGCTSTSAGWHATGTTVSDLFTSCPLMTYAIVICSSMVYVSVQCWQAWPYHDTLRRIAVDNTNCRVPRSISTDISSSRTDDCAVKALISQSIDRTPSFYTQYYIINVPHITQHETGCLWNEPSQTDPSPRLSGTTTANGRTTGKASSTNGAVVN